MGMFQCSSKTEREHGLTFFKFWGCRIPLASFPKSATFLPGSLAKNAEHWNKTRNSMISIAKSCSNIFERSEHLAEHWNN